MKPRTRRRPRQAPSTSYDVAKIAGVSRSAVSRTFTVGASVSAKTRAKVLKAAQTLNYRPNIFARSLKTKQSFIIGLAVSNLDNQYYPNLVQRFSEEFARIGYRLLLFVTHGSTGADPVIDELLKFHVDALILASSSVSTKLAQACRIAGVPVLMFNNVDPQSDVTSISTDNELGGRMIADYLVAAEHRCFGYIAGFNEDSSSYERERGFTQQLRKHGFAAPARATGFFTFQGATRATRTLLNLPEPPDALFCNNDHMALAALEVARYEFGLEPGRHISIVGFDDVEVANWRAYRLTTYAQPLETMVDRTVELIRSAIDRELPPQLHEQIAGHMVVRDSARRPATGLVETAEGGYTWRPPKQSK